MPAFLSRTNTDVQAMPESSSLRAIDIAGFIVAGTIFLGIMVWFAIRTCRRRTQKKRGNLRRAAFLSVKVIRNESNEEKSLSSLTNQQGGIGFSREQPTSSSILPAKPDQVHNHDCRQSWVFAPSLKSRSSVGTPFSSPLVTTGGPVPKAERSSLFSIGSHYSSVSMISAASSTDSSPSSRKVLQLFSPILADELLLNVGDRLTVVRSFDDGWCMVGKSAVVSAPKSLFKSHSPPPPLSDNVELGMVPAWCFAKPFKGFQAERPVRSSSLGTAILNAPGFSSREELVSWSNF